MIDRKSRILVFLLRTDQFIQQKWLSGFCFTNCSAKTNFLRRISWKLHFQKLLYCLFIDFEFVTFFFMDFWWFFLTWARTYCNTFNYRNQLNWILALFCKLIWALGFDAWFFLFEAYSFCILIMRWENWFNPLVGNVANWGLFKSFLILSVLFFLIKDLKKRNSLLHIDLHRICKWPFRIFLVVKIKFRCLHISLPAVMVFILFRNRKTCSWLHFFDGKYFIVDF